MTSKEYQLPEIDNFYLDMNGIIHNCTHPCDGDVHFRISEAEMFEDISNYIETLFSIIKPREFFFMAVDGVAPRAKMNQQRGRRFRSAKEASDREEAALKKGDILPTEQRFDSNCITPGTDFMVKLNKELKTFIDTKLSSDPDWQRVKVILSGHETPGEGEHKVMDFIRFQRSQPGYNPDTRHCLYGLDTDLIMLGLSSHEPNFMLLREEIRFNGKKNEATKGKSQRVDPSKISFNVLYLTLLRDYIMRDFSPLKPKLPFKFDLEAIIDDWILICFLIGNDFIPHIPHFHIHKNALPKIFEVYQDTLIKLDGHMNEKGMLNLNRFKIFAKALAEADLENYKTLIKENGGECAKDDYSKLNMFIKHKMRVSGIRDSGNYHKSHPKSENPTHHSHNHQANTWYNIQRNNKSNTTNSSTTRSLHTAAKPVSNGKSTNSKPQNVSSNGRVGVHSFTEEQINNSITVCADGDFIDLSEEEYLSDEKFPDENHKQRSVKNRTTNRRSTPRKEIKEPSKSKTSELDDFQAYKQTYYREKLKLDPNKESVLKVVHEYVRALQWNLHYYYHGCSSWGWFYPYHYAPFISDVAEFTDVDMNFEMGEPFKPLDQLLSVLPAASSSLLPKIYRGLVTSNSSPLAQYFPTEVEYDLNGKQNDWEAVVLAPFIDEGALLKASVLCNLFLSKEERENNNHGPHLLFYHVGPKAVKGQKRRQQVPGGQVKCVPIGLNGFHLPRDKIKYGLLKSDDDMSRQNFRAKNGNRQATTNNSHHGHGKSLPAFATNSAGFPTLALISSKIKDSSKFKPYGQFYHGKGNNDVGETHNSTSKRHFENVNNNRNQNNNHGHQHHSHGHRRSARIN